MLKRKLVMTVLPLLTAGILVGSGFSAWTFGDGSANQNTVGNIYVTPVEDKNISLSVTAPNALQLDQGTGDDKLTNTQTGIQFGNQNGNVFSNDGTLSIAVSKDSSNNAQSCTITVTFGFDTATLGTYLEWSSDDLTVTIPSGITGTRTNGGTFTFANVGFNGTTANLVVNLNEATDHNKIFNYANGSASTIGKPADHSEWDGLNNAVTNTARQQFRITVSAVLD